MDARSAPMRTPRRPDSPSCPRARWAPRQELPTSLASPAVTDQRPRNLTRNSFHFAMGLGAVIAFEYALTPAWARLLATLALSAAVLMETSRRRSPRINGLLMRLFAPVAHPHEATHVNSATWYTGAVWILAWLSPTRWGVVGLLCLAAGDPAAALVGKRWGRVRFRNGRSLEGSLAFVLACAGVAGAYLWLFYDDLGAQTCFAMAAAAGAAGALAEQLSGRLDDNLTIPLAATAIAELVMAMS